MLQHKQMRGIGRWMGCWLVIVGSCWMSSPESRCDEVVYRGHLRDQHAPVNGSFDSVFDLFDAEPGGQTVGRAVTNLTVALSTLRESQRP